MPDVTERPSLDPLVINSDGRVVHREFNVLAASKLSAEKKLKAAGVQRGAIFRDFRGAAPDPNLRCVSISIKPAGDWEGEGGTYTCRATYEPINKTSQFAGKLVNGLELVTDGDPIFYVERSFSTESVDTDRHGDPILNTAGVPYEDQFKIPRVEEVIVFEWIRSRIVLADAIISSRAFSGKTNSSEWRGMGARTALHLGLEPQALDMDCFTPHGGLVRYRARVHYKPARDIRGESVPGWTEARLSMGRVEINPDYDENDPASKKLRPIMVGDADDADRQQVSNPVALNGSGFHIEDIDLNFEDPARIPALQTFEVIPQIDFAAMGI